jgi:hypothetical protein
MDLLFGGVGQRWRSPRLQQAKRRTGGRVDSSLPRCHMSVGVELWAPGAGSGWPRGKWEPRFFVGYKRVNKKWCSYERAKTHQAQAWSLPLTRRTCKAVTFRTPGSSSRHSLTSICTPNSSSRYQFDLHLLPPEPTSACRLVSLIVHRGRSLVSNVEMDQELN